MLFEVKNSVTKRHCDMRRCHNGAYICLQCWSHLNDPFPEPFIKKNMVDNVTDTQKTKWLRTSALYQKWEQRLHRCIASKGNYFEGDNIDV